MLDGHARFVAAGAMIDGQMFVVTDPCRFVGEVSNVKTTNCSTTWQGGVFSCSVPRHARNPQPAPAPPSATCRPHTSLKAIGPFFRIPYVCDCEHTELLGQTDRLQLERAGD